MRADTCVNGVFSLQRVPFRFEIRAHLKSALLEVVDFVFLAATMRC